VLRGGGGGGGGGASGGDRRLNNSITLALSAPAYNLGNTWVL